MNQKNQTDQKLFRDAMQSLQCKEIPLQTNESIDEETLDYWACPSKNADVEPIQANTVLSFARPGIQKKRIQQLKQGQLTPQAALDLHGNTKLEATARIETCIRKALVSHQTCIRIIHGKGMHTPQSSHAVLKSHVNNILQQTPAVLAFNSAPPQQGGQGALLVLLKSLRN